MPPEKFSATEANRKRDTIFYVNARMSQASLNSAWLLTKIRTLKKWYILMRPFFSWYSVAQTTDAPMAKEIQIILSLFLVIAMYYQANSSQFNQSLNLPHAVGKGQIMSKCIYEIIDFPKYHWKNLLDFCPGRFYRPTRYMWFVLIILKATLFWGVHKIHEIYL